MRERLNINGVDYEVVHVTTPESAEASGLPNLAAHMRDNGKLRQLGLRRLKGRVIYVTTELIHPRYGAYYTDPISLGRS